MTSDPGAATLAALAAQIEQALAHNLPGPDAGSILPGPDAGRILPGKDADSIAPRLLEAMRYSTTAGGKRIRPLLVLATVHTLGQPDGLAADGAPMDELTNALRDALLPACALEYVHTYSLIHDDLPAMDNDALRRGKPTCHVAFDQATAILAGSGLLTHAVHLLASCSAYAPATRLEMISTITAAAGWQGMLAGQSLDLASAGAELDEPRLEALHNAKTGALIRASVRVGALASAASTVQELRQLDDFARCLGLAFQVTDDVLDATGSVAHLGKTAGRDAVQGKNTYPRLLTLAGAQRKARELNDAALAALAPFGPRAALLRTIALRLRDRDR